MTEQASFKAHLAIHGKWRSRALRAVHDLRTCLRAAGAGSPESDARLRRALAAIETDRLTIAVAGDDRRGKTELINALFFADFGRRLLPVTHPGGACPLEIQWQIGDTDACLRLLPIDHLDSTEPLTALKAAPERWVRLPLHPQEPEQVSATLAEIHRTRPLSPALAARLGPRVQMATGDRGNREVPCWRYAVLSVPHPLLKKGLVLLDLPGLAATARDPALSRELLSRSDALLMTIAADQGVQASDLRLWQTYLCDAVPAPALTLVALTRTDLLPAERGQRAARLERLTRSTANVLGVERTAMHAVSAHDGLAAKIADKPARLRTSGIDVLESALAAGLTLARRKASRAVIEDNAGELLGNAVALITRRATDAEVRIRELQELDAQSMQLVRQSLERTRRDEQAYVRSVQLVQRAQRALRERAECCRGRLSADAFDHLAMRARARLRASWSTAGLRRIMRMQFDELQCTVAQTCTDAAAIARQVDAAYALMRSEAGIAVEAPTAFSPNSYRVEMDLLHAEAVRFVSSAELLLAPRGAAVERFERRLVQRARTLFEQLREDWDGWLLGAFAPLIAEVELRKARAERRLARYQGLKAARQDARAERTALLRERVELARQMTLLRNIRNSLDHEPSIEAGHRRAPYLATSGGEPVCRSG
jgi:hypothetical protein